MNPLNFWCPHCKAGPGELCKTSFGEAREWEHSHRVVRAKEATRKPPPAPVKLGPARLAQAIVAEAEQRGVSITYLGELGAPAEPDRYGVDYWVWHDCAHAEIKIEFRGWQHKLKKREADALLDQLKSLPDGPASHEAAERLLPRRRA